MNADHAKKVSIKNVIQFSGAFVAFFVGAAFGSGQEIMQFFTSFGIFGFPGLIAALLIFIFAGYQIQAVSCREGFSEPYSIFEYFCGKTIGKIYTYILVAMLYAEFVMMSAGAGATFEEYFGIPNFVGRAVIVILTVATVLLGLNRIVDMLGFTGPVIILFMAIIGIASIIMAPMTLKEGMETAVTLDMLKGADTWVVSGLKYASYVVLSLVPIWAVCGSRSNSIKEARLSSVTQVLLFSIACFVIILAQLMNVKLIDGTEIPNLVLARTYVPAIAGGFAIIILLGIYSTVTFELWYTVRKFSEEKTKRYYTLTIVLAAIGLFFSGLLPFSTIINWLYSAAYILGVILLIFMAVHMVGRWMGIDISAKLNPTKDEETKLKEGEHQ